MCLHFRAVVFRPRDFCPPGSLGGSVKGHVTLSSPYPELALFGFVFGWFDTGGNFQESENIAQTPGTSVR